MNIQAVRGTKDLFGEDILKFNAVVELAKKYATLYNYQEIEPPIIEFSNLFERNLGDGSDVVMKELYKFKDRSDNDLALRPEFTAGIVRAVMLNQQLRESPMLKLFSYGAVFRYDRPQAGRQRQFHQINFEYYGNSSYYAEVDVLQLGYNLLKDFGLNNITLEINSLGSKEARENYEDALKQYFTKYINELSDISKIRLEKNVLRILDSKEECDKKLLNDVPDIKDFYTLDDKEFFANILNKLELLGIKYVVNKRLVRGLDYYNQTVFEFTTTDLGAQATVLGGGRYDNLMTSMGGKQTPAVGFGGGIERIMLLLNKQFSQPRAIGIIPISEKEVDYCLNLQKVLKGNGLNIELFFTGDKVKHMFNLANRFNCKTVITVGGEEVLNNNLTVKDLDSGEETKIATDKVIEVLNNH